MASSADGIESPASVRSGSAIIPVLIATVTAVVVSMLLLGGFGYYLAKSGRLAGLLGTSSPAKTEQVVMLPTHPIALEPVIVNLADEGGKTYLRIGITLRVQDAELKKGEKAAEEKPKEGKGGSDVEAAVRDTALEVLGRQTAEGLLTAEGKENLKTELKAAITKRNPEQKVTDVFFTEFLVQR